MKNSSLVIKKPENFCFSHAVTGHGWYDLLPFAYDPNNAKLSYVITDRATGKVIDLTITGKSSSIKTEYSGEIEKNDIKQVVRHILRMDEAFDDFYELIDPQDRLSWAVNVGAGRLLRSATVYEDLIKTICTTNCSWSLTKSMVTKLVANLGAESINGNRAFPTASSMATVNEAFYRNEIKAGYRAPYMVEIAELVASGQIDPESWLQSELPTAELKKELKKIKGIGDYAAENLLKLLGRYDGLALDSWLRGGYYKKHNKGKVCTDKKIERHYQKFRQWRGLAIWCDMTEDWFNA